MGKNIEKKFVETFGEFIGRIIEMLKEHLLTFDFEFRKAIQILMPFNETNDILPNIHKNSSNIRRNIHIFGNPQQFRRKNYKESQNMEKCRKFMYI